MKRTGAALALLLLALRCGAGPQPLADSELAEVRGADGISFAVHLQLNRPGDGIVQDSRLSIGQTVEGRTTWMVMRNIGGTIQMAGLGIGVERAPDGTTYTALTLPAYTRFTDAGFDSFSVQADPHAAVSGNLGRISLNGEVTMQGQLRMWSH